MVCRAEDLDAIARKMSHQLGLVLHHARAIDKLPRSVLEYVSYDALSRYRHRIGAVRQKGSNRWYLYPEVMTRSFPNSVTRRVPVGLRLSQLVVVGRADILDVYDSGEGGRIAVWPREDNQEQPLALAYGDMHLLFKDRARLLREPALEYARLFRRAQHYGFGDAIEAKGIIVTPTLPNLQLPLPGLRP